MDTSTCDQCGAKAPRAYYMKYADPTLCAPCRVARTSEGPIAHCRKCGDVLVKHMKPLISEAALCSACTAELGRALDGED